MNMPNTDPLSSSVPDGIWSILKRPEPPAASERWLRWHPSELEACLAARGERLPAPLTTEELGELREAHRRWGADEATLANLDRLASPQARVIVTGQQPSLLAGPLLVIYKALAAIDLARRLGERHPELHFVPVFWVASEDHDFDEVRRVYWTGHSGQLEEFLIPQSNWQWGQMVGKIPTESILPRFKEMINNSTYKTEFAPEMNRLLEEVYGDGSTLESGFCRLLLRLLAGSGLVIVSPLARWLRRRAAAILAMEFEAPGASSLEIIRRGEALATAGITPSLHRAPEAINAFWVDGESRRYTLRLEAEDVQRTLPQNDEEFHVDQPPLTPPELRLMLAQNPEQFSANVVTRPMVQDSVLPTVAQVIGPGEAAYLAQVEAVYERFGVFAPLRWPRPQVTLIEPRVSRNLEKYDVDLESALSVKADELARMIIQRDMATTELHLVEEVRLHQSGEIEELRKRFGLNNPAVDSAFDKLQGMMTKGYAKITERMLYQRQQDERTLNQALATVMNSLRPNDQPQERLLNPVIPYSINYGPDWVWRLAGRIANDPAVPMQVFELAELSGGSEKPGPETPEPNMEQIQ